MTQLVLSLFPGIGLLDMAFEQEGFCVVRGPDVLWGGDIRNFHPPAGRFAGVIGGPPCQSFSSLANLVRARGYEPKFGNLIPEYERCVAEAGPAWFVMEEVRAAPVPQVRGYAITEFLWCNSWVCGDDGLGQEQERLRRFSFGARGDRPVNLRRWMQPAALLLPEAGAAVTQWTPDNSPEARTRSASVVGSPLGIRRGGELERQMRPERTRSKAVLSTTREVPVAVGGSGKRKRTAAVSSRRGVDSKGQEPENGRYTFADCCRLQGLPENFLEHAPWTARGKLKAVANGVPLPMGRAIARAVKAAIGMEAAA